MAQAQAFVIAPMLEAHGYCQEGDTSNNLEQAIARCAQQKNFGVQEIKRQLDQLEPGGAKGSVQVGYTVVLNLLRTPAHDEPDTLAFLSQALRTIDRPVVIYLFGNHFAATTANPPVQQDSLAQFAGGTVPTETYFNGSIAPITLSTDPALSVNQQRLQMLQKVGAWYQALPPQHKEKILAFTLAGELHHFYDDFSKGMGKFDNIRTTDYSALQTNLFQIWLQEKYTKISSLNETLGTDYDSFSEVKPPHKNLRLTKIKNITEHFDSYAHGHLPIEGWLKELPAQSSIKVYLNGKHIADAEYGLNRQDVYEALPEAPHANIGFRYVLDFSQIPHGQHTIQVFMEGTKTYELGRRDIIISGLPPAVVRGYGRNLNAAPPPKNLRFHLDRPGNFEVVFYNPLARDWLLFRQNQVSHAYQQWMDWSVAAGLPAERLFSHQIAVATIGGWNPVLSASDASIQGKTRYKKGINLYGGSANMALLRKHYLADGESFGVPEFHTQAWKNPHVPEKTLQNLKNGGAVFVTPYFLSMAPDKYRASDNAHDKFRVSPDNQHYGSHYFYKAIQKIAAE